MFSKASYKRKLSRQASHDGNREWITLVACICADGTALPPGLIFAAESQNTQSTWVSAIDKKKHRVSTAVSPYGWSNDDAGLAWLDQVFKPETLRKAHGKWRLLLLDGHCSHITMDFIKMCIKYRILPAIYPPHSTHTLQPLDVVCFSPLAGNYSRDLTDHLHTSQGLTPFKKGDFFKVFWPAWVATFTPELVKRVFEATGLVPFDPDRILDRFTKSEREEEAVAVMGTPDDWRTTDRVLQGAVRDTDTAEVRGVRQVLHSLYTQNELLKIEKDGFRFALSNERSKPKKGEPLPLVQREETQVRTQWWSPRALESARKLQDQFDAEERDRELAKSTRRELQESNRLLKEKLAIEKEEVAERKAEERRQIDARKAQRAKDKEARDASKALQLSQRDKRPASQASRPEKKQKRGAGGGARGVAAAPASPSPPPKTTTRGRNVEIPAKFK